MRPKCRLPKCLAKGSNLRICLHKVCHLASNFMKEYWAHGLVIGLGSAISIALAIPFMSYLGLDCIAKPLFFAFHYLCAQTPSHSCYFLRPSVRSVHALPRHLYHDVPGQSDFCVNQKACACSSLVDLDIDATTHSLGWSDTDGRMAREHLDATCGHWLALWAGKRLVRSPADA